MAGLCAVALAAATFAPIGSPGTPAGAETTLPAATFVATHPFAAAQSTATGRTLADLAVHDGKVFAGYGDYGANTGPITVTGYDPVTGTFEPGVVADTEAVLNLREIGGELYAPSTDPKQSADYSASDPWRNVAAVGATHVYDMVTLTGTDLWMVGSKGNDAVTWRSLDGGATWTESLRIAPEGTGYNRFYFAGVLGGKLYVQPYNSTLGTLSASVFDGTTWSAGPSVLAAGGFGWAPEVFGGQLLLHGFGHGYSSPISAFDGTTTRTVATGYDIDVHHGVLYVLSDGRVMASTDGVRWTDVAEVPLTARSLSTDGTVIWVGTTDAGIWSAPLINMTIDVSAPGAGGSEPEADAPEPVSKGKPTKADGTPGSGKTKPEREHTRGARGPKR